MIEIRRAAERGATRTKWLDSRHSFSFGDYHDEAHMAFRALRVLNDDRVQPASGFGMHGHADMEILSYVMEGTLAHRDSTGGHGQINAGEVQRMTAGTGIRHSEMNPSPDTTVHFLQIWLTPERRGLRPEYQQASFPEHSKRGRLQLIASRDSRSSSLGINQDVDVYAALLGQGQQTTLDLAPGRSAWVQVARGAIELGDQRLEEGDGAAVTGERSLVFSGTDRDAELLVLDLA